MIGCIKFSSNDDDPFDNLPIEISKKIKAEKENSCLDVVYSYLYNDKTVYFFSYPCPEGCYSLLNKNGDIIIDANEKPVCYCNWGGAFCSDDFWENKKNQKLIWKKK